MPTPSPSGPSADSLFAFWLARHDSGEAADFESLCRQHTSHATRLRALHAHWVELEAIRRHHGLGGSLSEKLKSQYGSGVDPQVTLEGEEQIRGDFSSEVLSRLAGRGSASTRYRVKGEVAHGGMGAVLRVWDEDLRRHLAMKVMLGKGGVAEQGDTPQADPRMLARFLEEAQVTGQLDHPGIVPVHELGLDTEGRVYFTMKLVKGKTLKEVFDELAKGEGGWTQTRVLGLILKVCEAMSYAHDKGVIHRDLKPANIMVGRYGEVYVMDWGLARILGREDEKDIRLRAADTSALSEIRTDRKEGASDTPDSPLYTMDGDVVGTPAYMPPEQATGSLEAMGPHSDVYAVGAMLYHLLAGHIPYVPPSQKASNYMVLRWVREGPPASLDSEASNAPVELVAICEKAMAREWSARYRNMSEFAADLSAFLEHRVVRAYRTGALVELAKWVRRNRSLAGALATTALALVAGMATSLVLKARADRNEVLAEDRRKLADDQRKEAQDNLKLAQENERQAKWQSYVANMIAADASLQANETAGAKRLLEACDENLRGWEWQHYWLKADTSIVTLRGHERDVRWVAFSPDGTRIVSASDDGTVRAWTTEIGNAELVLPKRAPTENASMEGAALSPDGSLVAIARSHGGISILNIETAEVVKILPADPWAVSVAFSPDGSLIAGGYSDGTLRLWNVSSGETQTTFRGHREPATSIAFSPDGACIVTASAYEGAILLWDAKTGERIRSFEDPECNQVYSVSFSVDGARIVSGDILTRIRVWDTSTAKCLLVVQGLEAESFIATPWSVCLSPDGNWVASACGSNVVRIWDSHTGSLQGVLRGHDDRVWAVAFSQDGSRLASAGADNTIRLWDPRTSEPITTLDVAGDVVETRSVACSPNGSWIASGSHDHDRDDLGRVWDARTLELASILKGHDESVSSIAFSNDGSLIVTGSWDAAVRIWDPRTGELLHVLREGEDPGSDPTQIYSVAFSPNGQWIGSVGNNGGLQLWDIQNQRVAMELGGDGELAAACFAFSPQDPYAATGQSDNSVRLWDTHTGICLAVLPGHMDHINCVAFSPDGSRLASGSRDTTIRIWNVLAHRIELELRGHVRGVECVAYSPDGSRIASGSEDQTVRLWDAATGDVVAVLRGHSHVVTSVAFSAGGARLVSGSHSGPPRVWETDRRELHSEERLAATIAHTKALPVVNSLFDHLLFSTDVVGHLESDQTLTHTVREAAIRIARLRDVGPEQLNRRAWETVCTPGSEMGVYVRALQEAEAVNSRVQDDPEYLRTLGVAHYRVGRYTTALEILARVEGFNRHRPGDLAFLAMTHERLGNREMAWNLLLRLKTMMQDSEWAYNQSAKELLAEAEDVIPKPSESIGH